MTLSRGGTSKGKKTASRAVSHGILPRYFVMRGLVLHPFFFSSSCKLQRSQLESLILERNEERKALERNEERKADGATRLMFPTQRNGATNS